MKLLFLARSLDFGGAERQLVTLASALKTEGVEVAVAVFYGGGPLQSELSAARVPICELGKRGRWEVIGFLVRLIRVCRRVKPDILHSYLDVPNILAVLLRPFLPGTKVVWGIRASNMELCRYDWLSRMSFQLQCRLSGLADLIIANSNAGAKHHLQHGFLEKSLRVVFNGIDTDRFRFDSAGRQHFRSAWGAKDTQVLIGLAARLDPMKGHETFLAAARLLADKDPHLRFVCIGGGSDETRQRLVTLSRELGIDDRIVWAGPVAEMPAAYSALDVAVSCSIGEGFSNAIAEAMACGRPCVVTDVGDSALIVDDTGEVAPARDALAFAAAVERLLIRMGEEVELGYFARRRIERHFSVQTLTENTLATLKAVA